jgi:NagD protein
VDAYFVGKPNPLIMRLALSRLGCQREETVIIGDRYACTHIPLIGVRARERERRELNADNNDADDRMDTDIVAGVESEIDTVLVLSGVTSPAELHHFAYNPAYILDSIADITRTIPLATPSH